VALPLSDEVSSSVRFWGQQAPAVANAAGALFDGWPVVRGGQKDAPGTREGAASAKSRSEGTQSGW